MDHEIFFLAALLVLSACGVKGDPEPPPEFTQAR
ncbi:MAG: lipoprotein [Rhizobiales bacterium]|nr:lipoprotein [Hyphomicrobiales bacterium]